MRRARAKLNATDTQESLVVLMAHTGEECSREWDNRWMLHHEEIFNSTGAKPAVSASIRLIGTRASQLSDTTTPPSGGRLACTGGGWPLARQSSRCRSSTTGWQGALFREQRVPRSGRLLVQAGQTAGAINYGWRCRVPGVRFPHRINARRANHCPGQGLGLPAQHPAVPILVQPCWRDSRA